ncbi:TonB-dependent receptor [Marinihelvus fidelis]|uniref:TonB-dependent receptor n=1 Tax=Marinihelvus fidelis TaxID=2613842 RepID=A0A5N0TGB1_9GAMM|nr:TonB-dependent receptor [Marinihelvus fidelis]KAA9134125.1 TonB-dependent receptor [Marinihelvus fidelis]
MFRFHTMACQGMVMLATVPAIALASDESPRASEFGPGVLEEVIVTAQKREQPLRDVPISISVIDGQALENSGLLELEDLSAQVPGFTVTEAAVSTLVFVRGLGSGINPGFEQSVGMYVDGVYAGRGRQYRAAFLDVERVELLRGPQGTLFGKNTIAGAINITTARPQDEFGGHVSAMLDAEHGEQLYNAVLTGPLAPTLDGRFAVRAGQMDGWMFNSVPGRDETDVDEHVVRGMLRWQPGEDVDALFKLEHSRYRTDGRSTQITNAGPWLPLYQGWDPAFEDQFDLQKSVGGIGLDHSDTETLNALLSIDRHWSGLTLTSVTGWMSYDYADELDVDFGPIPNLFQHEPQDFSQFSQEFRLATATDQPVSYMAGVYFEAGDLDHRLALDADLTTLGLPLPLATRNILFDQDSHAWAVFGQATWQMTDLWRLNAGLRYTRESKSALQSLWFTDFQQPTPNPVYDAIFAAAGFGIAHTFDQDRDEDNWSPSLSVQFDASDTVTAYASAARGFKAGGFNAAEVTGDPDNFEFENETATTFELGAKTRFAGDRARVDIALFHTRFDDLQVSTFEGVNFVVGNAAQATSRGIELDGSWRVSKAFTLNLAWSFLDAEYDHFPNAACTIAQTIESGLGPMCTQDLSGRPTQYAPGHAGRVSLAWEQALSGGQLLFADLGVSHSDGYFVDQDLDPNAFQPAYQKVDLRLGWASANEHWTVALLGRNLGDELTRNHGSDVPLLAGAHYSTTDRPRSVALQVRYGF